MAWCLVADTLFYVLELATKTKSAAIKDIVEGKVKHTVEKCDTETQKGNMEVTKPNHAGRKIEITDGEVVKVKWVGKSKTTWLDATVMKVLLDGKIQVHYHCDENDELFAVRKDWIKKKM